MKRIMSVFMTAFMVLSLFTSCAQDADNSGEDAEKAARQEELVKLKAVYETLLSTWKVNEDLFSNEAPAQVIVFASDSVTLDGTKYEINQDEDLLATVSEEPEIFKDISIKITEAKYLNIDICEENWIYIENFMDSSYGHNYTRVSSGTEEDGDSGIEGSYAFTSATGSQSNGTLTLSDGTWSYSGSKSNPAASSGTYSVSGSKITFSWTANSYDVTETFTVTVDDTDSTWKSDNAYTSTFLSMLFGVTGTEITFDFSKAE